MRSPIFILGTGRSGTHWLGLTLTAHPDIRGTIEQPQIFSLSKQMAIDLSKQRNYLWKLILQYKWQILISTPRHYLDKSHPNIWHADKLIKYIPNAKFLGIERDPFATVASMMRHKGVLAWQKNWRKYPIPNKFLGITSENVDKYDSLPLATQCSMRWLSHHNRMVELCKILNDSIKVISYEKFSLHTQEILKDLEEFLELSDNIPLPEVRSDSLLKWKEQLSETQIEQIANVVGFSSEIV